MTAAAVTAIRHRRLGYRQDGKARIDDFTPRHESCAPSTQPFSPRRAGASCEAVIANMVLADARSAKFGLA